MTEDHDRFVADLAAYALDALDADGRAGVEAHLRDCTECSRLLREYCAVARLLPYTLATEAPPPDTRAALLARARERAVRPTPATFHRGQIVRHVRPLRWAVVGVLFLGLLLWNIGLQVTRPDRMDDVERLARLPHGHVAVLVGAGAALEADGRLYVDEGDERGALAVAGLPALPPRRAYQLWFIRRDQSRVSGAVFQVDARGAAALVVTVPGTLGEYVGIAVTEEPAGGSPTPTGRDMLVASL